MLARSLYSLLLFTACDTTGFKYQISARIVSAPANPFVPPIPYPIPHVTPCSMFEPLINKLNYIIQTAGGVIPNSTGQQKRFPRNAFSSSGD